MILESDTGKHTQNVPSVSFSVLFKGDSSRPGTMRRSMKLKMQKGKEHMEKGLLFHLICPRSNYTSLRSEDLLILLKVGIELFENDTSSF